MGTILESVNNLSEKLGVEEREQTIKDQLDLCVERLGGEGYSADIAESANKFADKEDGTATFTTKSITENGTYTASDDGVSGYSSVSVDVPSAPTPETFEVEFSISGDSTVTANKTYDEALAAINAGKQMNAIFTTVPEGLTIIMSGIPYKLHIKTNGEVDYIVTPVQITEDEQEFGGLLLWKDNNTIVMDGYD